LFRMNYLTTRSSLLVAAMVTITISAAETHAKSLSRLASIEEWSAQQHWSPFRCLAKAIYFEARSEPIEGQRAVAWVILNRVQDQHHPDTVCGVVYENTLKKNRCQFSFACDGRKETIKETRAYLVAQSVAREVLDCDDQCRKDQTRANPLTQSTHYHNTQVSPSWRSAFVRTGTIGQHIFYAARPVVR